MTDPSSPVNAVVFLSWQMSSGDTVTTEQASGVLIASDEVLTAAHFVYDEPGQTVGDVVISSAARGQPLHAVASEAGVHATPFTDWTQIANAGSDFALLHLATPLTGLPVMALGSGFDGGTASVTGYPVATSGAQDDAEEVLTPLAWSNDILVGAPLGLPGDPRGSSGGPVWQMVDGTPTLVGLVSSANGATGYFTDLSAADVAEIDAWMAADRGTSGDAAGGGKRHGTASAAISTLEKEAFELPAIAHHAPMDAAMHGLVSLLARDAVSLGAGAGFDPVAADALSRLGGTTGHRNLAVALLEGVVWGYDGGNPRSSVAAMAATDPGVTPWAASQAAVHAGARLGHVLFGMSF